MSTSIRPPFRNFLMLGVLSIALLVIIGPSSLRYLKGSVTDDRLLTIADADHDGVLSYREMRRSIGSFIRAMVAPYDPAYDLNDDHVINRSDVLLLIGSLRSFLTSQCGNGLLENVEQCDDGNAASGDGCSSMCKVEAGYKCTGAPSTCFTYTDAVLQLADADGNGVVSDREATVVEVDLLTVTEQPFADVKAYDVNRDGVVDATDVSLIRAEVDRLNADPDSAAVCGNGRVEATEACDDGNTVEGGTRIDNADGTISVDGCTNACHWFGCGDGVRSSFETCDDGNRRGTDACTSRCQVARCGDGFLQIGVEQCDPGISADAAKGCSSTCTLPVCGNGIKEFREQCDDGNQSNDDGCLTSCRLPVCGNGIKEGTEQCDDGNTSNEDNCSTTCRIPTGCGDGIVQTTKNEQCDDGNQNNDDGCTNECKRAACGDGIKSTLEQCDDGNRIDTDACTNNCTNAVCGDRSVRTGIEQCDDGNQNDADACRNTCVNATCGDGVVAAGIEQCDDGNNTSGDGCNAQCRREECGNAVLDPGEQCDMGGSNGQPNYNCTTSCTLPVCGDGRKEGTEQCDDGNTSNTDSCTNTCKPAACLDGFVQAGEECDDGNWNNDDGCSSKCLLTICGNHRLDPGEKCDDGNIADGDGCSSTCVVEANATCQTISVGMYFASECTVH